MANPYEEMDKKLRGSDQQEGPAPDAGNIYAHMDAANGTAPSVTPQESGVTSFAKGVGQTADDFVRAMANGVTFGQADRLAGFLNRTGTAKEEELSHEARARSPVSSVVGEVAGSAVPLGRISHAVGALAPSLARHTIPSIMGNAAVTGGVGSVVNNALHGETDPAQYATDAAIEGAAGGVAGGVVGGLARMIPSVRIRTAGNPLTDTDKSRMAEMAATAGQSGVPLRISELAKAVAPGRSSRLETLAKEATLYPEGSAENIAYEGSRTLAAGRAAQQAADQLGPEVSGVAAQNAAVGAQNAAKGIINRSAEPYFKRAMSDSSEIPGSEQTSAIRASIARAARQVRENPVRTADIADGAGITPAEARAQLNSVANPPPAGSGQVSVATLDKLRHGLESENVANIETRPDVALRARQARQHVTEIAEKASPDYATANQIERQGRAQMLDEVNAGPVGKIAATTDPRTQARSIFGALTPMEEDASRRAISRVGEPAASGLLSGDLRRAAAEGANKFRDVLPSDASMRLASQAAGPVRMGRIADTINALRAIDPINSTPIGATHAHGPFSFAIRKLQGAGSGSIIEQLADPSAIAGLGKIGGKQQAAQAASLAVIHDILNNVDARPLTIRRRRYGENNP